ncbi:hypothetical protein RhiirA4_465035 [Rhizophagus irregularis]|uniref:Uncharacterized protein n=1 Tax=Rhizophagus irregularis TaxID=588596 RepID=A0A2I1GRG1_9GLOM|nr:hypothetical protein RhiirA4_465035 [Rhizophagus irregularis]
MNQFFPTSKQIQNLANKARNGTLVQILTGKDLLKPNLERKLLLNNQHCTINVDEIWAHLTTSDDINNIRNSSFIELIARINTTQTNTTLGTLGNNFFSGTNFQENNSVESLILPLGTIYERSFQ